MSYQRPDTLPHEVYYHGHPDPYLQPSQSKYHNVGMIGHIPNGAEYPGKRGGTHGDYGPRQKNWDQTPQSETYPLDVDTKEFHQRAANYAGSRYTLASCNTPNPRAHLHKYT